MSRWDPDPDEVRDVRPYDFASAKRAIARASREHTAAADAMSKAYGEYAEKERAYRKALAKRIVQLKAEGMAVTAAGDVARGDELVANLKYARDVAEGAKEAAAIIGFTRAADRREVEQLVAWSMKIDLRALHTDPVVDARTGEAFDPETGEILGGRRAA